MKQLNLSMLLVMGLSILTVSCVELEENKSADANGNCSGSFAKAYSDISRNVESTFFDVRKITTVNLNSTHQACQSFF